MVVLEPSYCYGRLGNIVHNASSTVCRLEHVWQQEFQRNERKHNQQPSMMTADDDDGDGVGQLKWTQNGETILKPVLIENNVTICHRLFLYLEKLYQPHDSKHIDRYDINERQTIESLFMPIFFNQYYAIFRIL